jgi:hypothetical protein
MLIKLRFRFPEIFLGVLLAVAIFAIGMAFQSSRPHQQNEQNATSQQNATDKIHNRDNAQSLWVPVDSIGLYTLVLAAFTGLLVIVSGVQGYFLLRADKTARTAADAAKKSAEISERALIVTQRAFIRVANFPWLWRPDTARPGRYFYDITPIVENFGNTPTVEAKINVNSGLRDTILPDDFDFPYQGEAGDTLVGPKQTIGTSRAEILDEDLLAVQGGQKFFYIWGMITYRDVFDGTPLHTTEFCTQISRVLGNPLDPKDPNNPRGTTVEISFRIYPKHQKTD